MYVWLAVFSQAGVGEASPKLCTKCVIMDTFHDNAVLVLYKLEFWVEEILMIGPQLDWSHQS